LHLDKIRIRIHTKSSEQCLDWHEDRIQQLYDSLYHRIKGRHDRTEPKIESWEPWIDNFKL